MRRTVSCVLAIWLLTACGANDADSANTLTLPPTTTEPPTLSDAPTSSDDAAAPSRNERNNIVKQFGELARIVNESSGADTLSFTVDSIEVDPPCSDNSLPPENGHFLVLNMRVTTGSDLSSVGGTFFLTAGDWRVVGADGITETGLATGPAYGCIEQSERISDVPLGAGQQFVGKIVLDSKNPSGAAIYAPPYVPGGWEWVF